MTRAGPGGDGFLSGLASTLVTATVVLVSTGVLASVLRQWARDAISRKQSNVSSAISLPTFEKLCFYGRPNLRKSAVQVLLDRLMRPGNLQVLLHALSTENTDVTLKLHAVSAAELLLKSGPNKELLAKRGLLKHLIGCLDTATSSEVQRVSLLCLFDLVYQNEGAKRELAGLGGIPLLVGLLGQSPSRDICYWALVVQHQLTTLTALHPDLLAAGCLEHLIALAMRSQGNNDLQKLCVHCLVLLATGPSSPERVLHQVLDAGLIPKVVACLKSDDAEVVYWSLSLIHELALKGVGKEELRQTPKLLKHLRGVLNSSEAQVQKVLLRTLGFLAIKDMPFKQRIVDGGLCERLVICMTSGDLELAHWAVVLVHDIAMMGPAVCEHLVQIDAFVRCINILIERGDKTMSRLAAESYGFMCTNDAIHERLISDGILTSVHLFAVSDDPELKFWAAALLLNLVMSSSTVWRRAMDLGLVQDLVHIALTAEKEQVLKLATKALVLLGLEHPEVDEVVQRTMLGPIVQQIASSQDGLSSTFHVSTITLLLRNDRHKAFVCSSDVLPMLFQAVHRFVALDFVTSVLDQRASRDAVVAIRLLCVILSSPRCARELLRHRLEKLLTVLLCCIIRRVLAVQQVVQAKRRQQAASPGGPHDLNLVASPPTPARHARPDDTDPAARKTVSDSHEPSPPTTPLQAYVLHTSTSTPVLSGPRTSPLALESSTLSPVGRGEQPDSPAPFHNPATESSFEAGSSARAVRPVPRDRLSSARSLTFDAGAGAAVGAGAGMPGPGLVLPRSLSEAGNRSLMGDDAAFDLPAVASTPEPGRRPRTPLARLRSDMMAPPGITQGEDISASHPDVFSPRTRWLTGASGAAQSMPELRSNDPRRLHLSSSPGPESPRAEAAAATETPGRRRRHGSRSVRRSFSEFILGGRSDPSPTTSPQDAQAVFTFPPAGRVAEASAAATAVPSPTALGPDPSRARAGNQAPATPTLARPLPPPEQDAAQQEEEADDDVFAGLNCSDGLLRLRSDSHPEERGSTAVEGAELAAGAQQDYGGNDSQALICHHGCLDDHILLDMSNLTTDLDMSEISERLADVSLDDSGDVSFVSHNGSLIEVPPKPLAPMQFTIPQLQLMRDVLSELTQYATLAISCMVEQCDRPEDKLKMRDTGIANILVTAVYAFSAPAVTFQAERTLHHLCTLRDGVDHGAELESSNRVKLSRWTRHISVSQDRLEVRNDSWTFETAECECSATGDAVVYFEARIKSSGIIQVGWAVPGRDYDVYRGLGVGDDEHSYAFDGTRGNGRLWHTFPEGPSRDYGRLWQPGNIVGCEYNGRQRTLSFSINGEPLGPACQGLDTSLAWAPVCSLSSGTQVRLVFDTPHLRFMPAHCRPLSKPPSMPILAAPSQLPLTATVITQERAEVSPILYFEVEASDLLGRSFGFQDKTALYTAWVDAEHFKLEIDGHAIGNFGPLSVLGCGLAAQGCVFFCVDGYLLDTVLVVQTEFRDFLPALDVKHCRVNFGQQTFCFAPCNSMDTRARIAQNSVERCASYLSGVD